MAGNAKEWVEDYYHDNYVGAPADGHPWLYPETALRVIRNSYTFMREGHTPATDAAYSGIRCCRDVAPQTGP
jgi:formylglycine-generating enzyme required for sulfatase activity